MVGYKGYYLEMALSLHTLMVVGVQVMFHLINTEFVLQIHRSLLPSALDSVKYLYFSNVVQHFLLECKDKNVCTCCVWILIGYSIIHAILAYRSVTRDPCCLMALLQMSVRCSVSLSLLFAQVCPRSAHFDLILLIVCISKGTFDIYNGRHRS